MQTARPTILLPVLLTLPFTAYADGLIDPLPADEPIPENSLVIDYEGTIFEVSDAPPEYAVGDRIAGRLLVDLSVPVHSRSSPTSRTYESISTDFVRGFWISGGDGEDSVSIANEQVRLGDDRPVDTFSVRDEYIVTNGSGDGAMTFSLHATLYDFLDSLDIHQSFEVSSADADQPQESAFGLIRFSNMGAFFVKFALDRFSVKPGRCFAP
jgi:hypothetical protein